MREFLHRFGSFSDCFGSFRTGPCSDRSRIILGPFRTTPFSKIKFQLARAGARPEPTAEPSYAAGLRSGALEFEFSQKFEAKTKRKNETKNDRTIDRTINRFRSKTAPKRKHLNSIRATWPPRAPQLESTSNAKAKKVHDGPRAS